MKYGIADIYADTIYSGCSIGTYTLLSHDKYCMRGEAKSDVLVLAIKKEVLEKYAKLYPDMKKIMVNYEKYVAEFGPPFFDYKLFKGQLASAHIFKKWQQAVKRLIRINKSYKYAEGTNAKANYQVSNEGLNKLSQRKITHEARSEASIILDNEDTDAKLNLLIDIVKKQSYQIDNLTKLVEKQNQSPMIVQSNEYGAKYISSENDENMLKDINLSAEYKAADAGQRKPDNKLGSKTMSSIDSKKNQFKNYMNQVTKMDSQNEKSIEEVKHIQTTNYDFTENKESDVKIQNLFYESNENNDGYNKNNKKVKKGYPYK